MTGTYVLRLTVGDDGGNLDGNAQGSEVGDARSGGGRKSGEPLIIGLPLSTAVRELNLFHVFRELM